MEAGLAAKKTQVNIRVSDLTERQIDELAGKLGMNKTEIITLAVDRLFQAELDYVKCANCGNLTHQSDTYRSKIYKGKICPACYDMER